jgi:hypothetical protein
VTGGADREGDTIDSAKASSTAAIRALKRFLDIWRLLFKY